MASAAGQQEKNQRSCSSIIYSPFTVGLERAVPQPPPVFCETTTDYDLRLGYRNGRLHRVLGQFGHDFTSSNIGFFPFFDIFSSTQSTYSFFFSNAKPEI